VERLKNLIGIAIIYYVKQSMHSQSLIFRETEVTNTGTYLRLGSRNKRIVHGSFPDEKLKK
jgi:hypothetical protein